ncbi:hypothetical protein [Stappia indica]|uniref:hypothetical protein n=1 Tax=Stappia indica TaxID=538381 RepID=UPI001D1822C1|nr:hypothetical protein [Stappia indica]MCC4243931.1 hypothetical protein [Stappia indica]
MPFSPDEIRQLPDVISAPRFATYLRVCDDNPASALALYQWNLEISAAFIVPIQICEVAVRNGVVYAIEAVHGADWPWSNGFIRSLPRPKASWHYDPQDDLRKVASRAASPGKVVAELKFAFWEKLFTRGQDIRLWEHHFRDAFPGAPQTLPVEFTRGRAFANLQAIRRFRNRIAHHEPIFARDLVVDHQRLREMIEWRNPAAALWLDRMEKVSALLACKP